MSTAFPLCLRLLEHGRFSGVSPPLAPPRTLLVGPSTPLLEAADNMDYLATRGPQSPRIVRPSTAQTPLSMLRMGELIQEAGIPAGDLFFSLKKKPTAQPWWHLEARLENRITSMLSMDVWFRLTPAAGGVACRRRREHHPGRRRLRCGTPQHGL